MITIERTEAVGFMHAIRGMRNPMNSWDKSDSGVCYKNTETEDECSDCPMEQTGLCAEQKGKGWFVVGDNDSELMKKLAHGGPVHAKYRRMIIAYADITAPLYWWKEFDTYKVGTVANSCSTMHKIHEKELTIDDFSHEHIIDFFNETDVMEYMDDKGQYHLENYPVISIAIKHELLMLDPFGILERTIHMLNKCRELYLETKDKIFWQQMIQLLPSSYNQKRTVMMNYEVLSNIFHHRKNHKLDEWKEFCKWIESLPCSELITCNGEEEA